MNAEKSFRQAIVWNLSYQGGPETNAAVAGVREWLFGWISARKLSESIERARCETVNCVGSNLHDAKKEIAMRQERSPSVAMGCKGASVGDAVALPQLPNI